MTNNVLDARIITEEERKVVVQLFLDLIRHNANKTQMVGFCFSTWDRKGNISCYSKSLIETNIEAILDVTQDTLDLDATDDSYMPDRFKE